MVTTRSKTDSLPAKRAPEEELTSKSKKNTQSDTVKGRTAQSKAPKVAPKKSKPKTKLKCSSTQSSPPAVTSIVTHPGSSNRFLDLPAEIRNAIYNESLIYANPINIRTSRPFLNEPALLAVNRQVRSEALSTYWSENMFRINGSSPAVKFLRSLSDERLSSLQQLQVDSDPMTLVYQRDRIRHLLEEFGPRGLSRRVIRFPTEAVEDNGGTWRAWYTLDEVKRLIKDQTATAVALSNAKGTDPSGWS